jgi:hypothetical protein
MADVDLPVAESAYATLLDARHRPRNMAADLVRPLRTETRNEKLVDLTKSKWRRPKPGWRFVRCLKVSTPNLKPTPRSGRERSAARKSGEIF